MFKWDTPKICSSRPIKINSRRNFVRNNNTCSPDMGEIWRGYTADFPNLKLETLNIL